MSRRRDTREEREIEIKEFPLHTMATNSKIAIIGKPGCFGVDTPVMMYDKTIKNVQDVEVGDMLMGDDFTPRFVTELCFGKDYLYKVLQTSGSNYIVNSKHILSLVKDENIIDINIKDYLQLNEVEKIKYKGVRTFSDGNVIYSDIIISRYDYNQYYGFIIDGNHRFLLKDNTVVHNTGKTTLLCDILYTYKHIYPVAQVMSGTEDSNGFYKDIFPSMFIYNELNEDALLDWIKRQKIAKKYIDNPWELQLLDDCTDDPKVLNRKLFHSIFKNGRHWSTMFILSLQYCLDIRPVIRTNLDYSFILRESNVKIRKALWENYASCVGDFKDFCDIMDQITDDYTALVINNRVQSNDISDCVFYFKARQHDKFKFGCREYWEWNYERYNQEYKDPLI